MPPNQHHIATLSECLRDLDITSSTIFTECDSIDAEFAAVKKYYFRKVLKDHPDKGGDVDRFRKTQAAFEVVREMYQNGGIRVSLADCFRVDSDAVRYGNIYESFFGTTSFPSYEHYAEAAEEAVPLYFVELARSNRSKCVKCKAPPRGKKRAASDSHVVVPAKVSSKGIPFIDMGDIRVGSMESISGSYCRWNHLYCWRVPYKVWSGFTQPDDEEAVLQDLLFMNEVVLAGVADLNEEDKRRFLRHCLNKDNWAKQTSRSTKANIPDSKKNRAVPKKATRQSKRSSKKDDEAKPSNVQELSLVTSALLEPVTVTSMSSDPATNDDDAKLSSLRASISLELTKARDVFIIPRPGVDGAIVDCLSGKRFVLTGIFPEVGKLLRIHFVLFIC